MEIMFNMIVLRQINEGKKKSYLKLFMQFI